MTTSAVHLSACQPVRLSACFAMLLALAPAAAAAQQAASAPQVVFEGQLGGDSATARRIRLTAGVLARIEVRPATAQLVLRPWQTGEQVPAALAQQPLPPGDSVPGGTGFVARVAQAGDHLLMLANPGIGAAHIRMTLSRPPGDTTALTVDLACARDADSAECRRSDEDKSKKRRMYLFVGAGLVIVAVAHLLGS